MTTTTVDLQIVPLCNNIEFIKMVESTLRGIAGVEVLIVNYQNGNFTIKTTKNPEEIRHALQHLFPGKSVILSKRINHSNPLNNPRSNSSIQGGPLNSHDMAEAMVTVSHAKGLRNVEYKQSTTININFNDQPTTSGNVRDSEDGYVNAAPSPPPPRQYTPWATENVGGYGGGGNDDYYGYVPPKPSAPLMPRAEAEGYVYGHPLPTNNYMEDDYSGACCTILLYLFYGFLILFLVKNIHRE